MPTTQTYDVADYLGSDEMVLAYLEEAFDTNEPRLIAKAVAAVARARAGQPQDAQDENARRALETVRREGETVDLNTAFQALRALGLKLTPTVSHPTSLAA